MSEISDKINYKGKASWGKEVVYKEVDKDLEEGRLLAKEDKIDVESLIGSFGDLAKKASKINKALDNLLGGLRIPIDPDKNPEVTRAVKDLDPHSKGLYITYSFYKKVLKTLQQASKNIELDDLAGSLGSGTVGNSEAIRKKLFNE